MSSSLMLSVFFSSMLCLWTGVECWSYYYSENRMAWESARKWCREHYTDMVAIQNQEEIGYLKNLLPAKEGYYWIGIRKIDDVWTWVGTNKPLTAEATNWATNEPNNGQSGQMTTQSEDCVEMYIKRSKDEGKWNDERCSKLKTALCYTAACKEDSCVYGDCVETINSHMCNCTPGFYGDRCEQVVKCNQDDVIIPQKGTVDCTHTYGNFSFDSLCHYSCEKGYKLSVSKPQRCQATKKWSIESPVCELIKCQEMSAPSRGSMVCSDPLGKFAYGSRCTFTCEEGYKLDDSSSNTLQCESSGNWNVSKPSCVAVQCPILQNPDNGFISCEDDTTIRFNYRKNCSFSCVPGYQLVGPEMVTCTLEAVWSEQMPRCEVVECPSLEDPENGSLKCADEKMIYGNMCSFSCEPGFELQGMSTIKCSKEGQWSKVIPSCKAVQCPALQELKNGALSCEDDTDMRFSYRKSCNFKCYPGYRLVGTASVTCTAEREWSGEMPNCEAITCQNPVGHAQMITNCSRSSTVLTPSSTCSFGCEPGFELLGAHTTTCRQDGQWSKPIPTCNAVRCVLLDAPENGQMNCSDVQPVFNSQCSFTCDQDYLLDRDEILTCDPHGSWTGKKPTCQAPLGSGTFIATSVAAGGTALASGLSLIVWILKKLKQKASKFELNSNSDIEEPLQVYKNNIDGLM